MVDIIIKKAEPKGRTRSSVESELREAGWGQSMTDEEQDKSKFLEREVKEKYGADTSHFKKHHIEHVK